MVGLSVASQATSLPAFAASLGAPNVVLGAIPAVMTLGWFLPSLFAPGHAAALARKLPFVLRHTVWERAPFLVLAVAAFVAADLAPQLVLGVLLAMLLVVPGVGGVLMPAWMDIVGRAIPVTLRGRFFALSNLAAAGVGFAGSFLTAHVLAVVRAPASFGVCFLCASACMALSYLALALVREPAATTSSPAVALGTYLRRIPPLLRRDANLRWFLVARAFVAVFLLTGVQGAAISISNLSVLLEFAPVPEEQPTYVGLGTTLMAPVALGAPLTAGLLADALGFAAVFALSAAAGSVALTLLLALVQDPRAVTARGDTKWSQK